MDDRASRNTTNALLTCGVLAGPLYVVIGSVEALARDGFDITRHSLSLLSNGDWGWVHSAMLVTTGLLTVLGAIGMRRVLRSSRQGARGALLVGLYGLGLIGAGIFRADPVNGFPPGTPEDASDVSWHGILHFTSAGIGFIGLIAACIIFARMFSAAGQSRWALYSAATGVIFLAAFVGIAAGSGQSGTALTAVNLSFGVAVVLGWAWVSAMSARLRNGSTA